MGNNVVAPAKVNEQRQRQGQADRQSLQGVGETGGGVGEGRQLSVPGQDMKRVRKFATIRMLPATCAAAPAATLKAIKKFKVAFKNAFHKFTAAPRCLLPRPLRLHMQNFDSSVCKSDSSIEGDGSDADADSDADCDNDSDSDTFPPFCCRQLVALAQNVDNF